MNFLSNKIYLDLSSDVIGIQTLLISRGRPEIHTDQKDIMFSRTY